MTRNLLATTAIAVMLASPAAFAQTDGSSETQPSTDGGAVSDIETNDGGGSGMNEPGAATDTGTAETQPAPGETDEEVGDPSSTEGGGTGMNETEPEPADERAPETDSSVEEEG